MTALLNPFMSFPASGGGGGSLPAGATWHLDFVNSFYYAGGASQIVTDILGGAFNPAYLTGAGLDTQYTNDNRPDAAGDLFTDMAALFAAGQSIIFTLDGEIDNAQLVMFADALDYGDVTNAPSCGVQALAWVDDWNDLFATVDPSAGYVPGIHKIGATWYRDVGGGDFESAVVLDGGAPGTQTTGYGGASMTPLRILVGHGGYPGGPGTYNEGFVITSMTGYPAMTPTALQALTV